MRHLFALEVLILIIACASVLRAGDDDVRLMVLRSSAMPDAYHYRVAQDSVSLSWEYRQEGTTTTVVPVYKNEGQKISKPVPYKIAWSKEIIPAGSMLQDRYRDKKGNYKYVNIELTEDTRTGLREDGTRLWISSTNWAILQGELK